MCAPKNYFYNKKLLLIRRRTGRGMWWGAGGSWRNPSWSRGPAWPWTWPPSPSCATCRERSLVTRHSQCCRQCFGSRLTESGSRSKHFAHSVSGFRMSLNPDPDQDYMTKKIFFIKNRPIQALREASSTTENSLNIKFLHSFLFWGTIFFCLDLDPLTHLNPDPEHWLPFFVEKIPIIFRIPHPEPADLNPRS